MSWDGINPVLLFKVGSALYYSLAELGKHDRLTSGLWKWCLFLVLMLCADELVRNFSWFSMKILVNEYMYWLGTVKISNFLNNILHEVLGCVPTIILIILFCKVNILLLLEEFPPQNYAITCSRVKMSKVNWSQSVIICNIVHLSNHVTCCTQFRNNLINVILPIKVIINLNTKKF